ncbi:MAG: hypothetical protein KIT27_01040 [Legionellales bacterium]|nr:hypothetical protein [Legionellales bacterium]
MNEFLQNVSAQIPNLQMMLMIVNAILHVLFAGAVARDAGQMHKIGRRPALVGAVTWSFATLLGGIVTVAIYWFIHYSRLSTRQSD